MAGSTDYKLTPRTYCIKSYTRRRSISFIGLMKSLFYVMLLVLAAVLVLLSTNGFI